MFLALNLLKNSKRPLKILAPALNLRIGFFYALDGIYTYYEGQRQYRKYLFHSFTMVLVKFYPYYFYNKIYSNKSANFFCCVLA
ncbi:MAG: hypothetical protein EAZ32_07895 [Cytophagia bacterium]|nr:MAG: hypothetical protein EAZ46_08275 [Runella sp.]TAG18507.1 MAG: hypothetical protein EAZ38_14585 [Cytophagales bacterium]TAG40026.1 MAG: hypothetical protein EAZ32_07895 [Cytophagia bacterium]TAG48233.1 MAG: hypothetical protein EAZ29_13605 [Runella slithyformis]TAG74995.1 MAG: hypothetical protein EAZ26_01335 [Runella slithyformis]